MVVFANSPLIQRLSHHYTVQYWIGQLVFWFCLSVVPFLGMTLWYNTVQWLYIQHMLLQAALGLLLSIPLGAIYSGIWKLHPLLRMVLILALAGTASAAWTWIRIVTYIWLTAEYDTWGEFGGWYFGAFYIFLCWSALYHGMKYYRLLEREHQKRLRDIQQTKEEQIKRLEAETRAREAQLKMLRYQINPHFLFNTLHAVHALIKLDQSEKATGMIGKLGGFLRYTLDFNPAQRVNLEDEIAMLKLYLDIESIRFSDRLQVFFDVEDAAQLALIPGFILQPLIENSIKYAIATSEDGGTISVNARVMDAWLVLQVTDSGPGLDTPAKDDSRQPGGVGLRNTVERLQTLYGSDYSFAMEPATPHGLRVSIQVPYEQDEPVRNVRRKVVFPVEA